jgi:hypothetical protein
MCYANGEDEDEHYISDANDEDESGESDLSARNSNLKNFLGELLVTLS